MTESLITYMKENVVKFKGLVTDFGKKEERDYKLSISALQQQVEFLSRERNIYIEILQSHIEEKDFILQKGLQQQELQSQIDNLKEHLEHERSKNQILQEELEKQTLLKEEMGRQMETLQSSLKQMNQKFETQHGEKQTHVQNLLKEMNEFIKQSLMYNQIKESVVISCENKRLQEEFKIMELKLQNFEKTLQEERIKHQQEKKILQEFLLVNQHNNQQNESKSNEKDMKKKKRR